jgi:hypothetical protein
LLRSEAHQSRPDCPYGGKAAVERGIGSPEDLGRQSLVAQDQALNLYQILCFVCDRFLQPDGDRIINRQAQASRFDQLDNPVE